MMWVSNAKIGRREALYAIKRLDEQARLVEKIANGPSLDDYITAEREHSSIYGGRSVGRR